MIRIKIVNGNDYKATNRSQIDNSFNIYGGLSRKSYFKKNLKSNNELIRKKIVNGNDYKVANQIQNGNPLKPKIVKCRNLSRFIDKILSNQITN